LEELYEGHTSKINVELAYHWEQAGELRKAAEYLRWAGEKSWRTGTEPDAFDFFERALAIVPEDDIAGRAQALVVMGWSHGNMGDLSAGVPLFREAPPLSREAGLPAVESDALQGLAQYAMHQGRHADAERQMERAVKLARQSGAEDTLAFALVNMGWLACNQGDLEKAARFVKEGVALSRKISDKMGKWLGFPLRVAAMIALHQREFEEQKRYTEEALAIAREMSDQGGIAIALAQLGQGAQQQGKYAEAVEYCMESLDIRRQIGLPLAWSLSNLGHAHIGLDQDRAARGYLCEALQESMATENRPDTGISLVGMAWLWAKAGRHAEAAELLGLVLGYLAFHEAIRQYAEPVLAMVREALPADEVEADLARGEALDLDQVVEGILAEE
jgi:tetratricopeptide (TPR) repeat protein